MSLHPTPDIATILPIQQVLDLKPRIPDYQRPYKWQAQHVSQLFHDLLLHFEQGKQYRIGTVVLHQHPHGQIHDIVDGQQRLITLSLLLHALGNDNSHLLHEKLGHSISHNNLMQNHQFIQYLLSDCAQIDKKRFAQYILGKDEDNNVGCDMVCVTLNNLDQAFQFFDSQNARGKPLEAYDLLKAYHLRAMQNRPVNTVHQCVANWESAAQADEHSPNLYKIINLVLFRLRRWHQQQSGDQFTSQELDTFKGIAETAEYPYLHNTIAARTMLQAASHNPMMFHPRFLQAGFQAQQALINGEWFFHYIEHYRQLYAELFHPQTGLLAHIRTLGQVAFDTNLIDYLNTYKNNWRAGDQYLRELFECTVLAYVDKFGATQLEPFLYKAFVWVYQKRLQWQRITFNTIDQVALDRGSLLLCIAQALQPKAVMQFMNQPLSDMRFDNVDDKMKELLGVSDAK
ncbi:DUF262 domain-containing protein [Vitreoscilla massiliensis]|uniref:DUF262 domain-containing protein n=1 Tax=Vitreoscilla massiliensis TaxID=1689272 RepID=A0ABY4DXQ2_9NEIS|nr:DUF262 domain-containing protein [Vitreoscilla massiliensis]UOO88297.1 DUF262 domain-containing protein [Vitreoscilla massiliensis]